MDGDHLQPIDLACESGIVSENLRRRVVELDKILELLTISVARPDLLNWSICGIKDILGLKSSLLIR